MYLVDSSNFISSLALSHRNAQSLYNFIVEPFLNKGCVQHKDVKNNTFYTQDKKQRAFEFAKLPIYVYVSI